MEKATAVAQEQNTSLLTGLQAVGRVKGCQWKAQQIVFVGGTCGSVHVESFNKNMKALGVLDSKWDSIRQKLERTRRRRSFFTFVFNNRLIQQLGPGAVLWRCSGFIQRSFLVDFQCTGDPTPTVTTQATTVSGVPVVTNFPLRLESA